MEIGKGERGGVSFLKLRNLLSQRGEWIMERERWVNGKVHQVKESIEGAKERHLGCWARQKGRRRNKVGEKLERRESGLREKSELREKKN